MTQLFSETITKLRNAFEIPLEGEYNMDDIYILKKDLAHCGGITKVLSIINAGTPFIKKIGTGYHSDGFHLILSSTLENIPEYFEKVKQS